MRATFSVNDILDPNQPLVPWLRARFATIRTIRYNAGVYTVPTDTYIKWRAFLALCNLRFNRPPDKYETRDWISNHVSEIMTRISPFPTTGLTAQSAEWVMGLNGPPVLDQFSQINRRTMAEIVAVDIVSAPSTSGFNGNVRLIGENGLAQLIVHDWSIPNRTQTNFPTKCSHGYVLVNLDDDKAVFIDQYPYLGDDRPARIDVSKGNPKWLTKTELSHVENDKQALGGNEWRQARRDSWVDVDFDDFFLDEDEENEDIGNIMSLPTTLYRRISPHIAAAAVYIAVREPFNDFLSISSFHNHLFKFFPQDT
jgi:hypothetical protein